MPARLDGLQRLFELFMKQHPVRQIGERVVMRQMRDLLFRALAFGDVLDGGDPAAGLQRLVDDLDGAAARRFRELAGGLAQRHAANDGGAKRLDIAVERAGLLAVLDQPPHRAALFGDVRRQAEHLQIRLIADDDARGGVVQHEALRNVIDGDAELTLFRGQRSIDPLVRHQQATDGQRQDGRNGEQHTFAKAQGRKRNTGQDGGSRYQPANAKPPRRRHDFGRIHRAGAPIVVAAQEPIESGAEPSHAFPNSRHACTRQVEVALRLSVSVP